MNLLLFAGAVAAAAGGTWFLLLQRARSALNARVVLASSDAKLGGEVPVQVHVRPREAIRVDRIVARTRCLRRTVEGPGRDAYEPDGWFPALFTSRGRHDRTRIEHDEVARSEIELSGPRDLRAGESQSFEAQVPVADGVPSDDVGPLTIRWMLEVDFEIPNSPDVTLGQPLRVQRRY